MIILKYFRIKRFKFAKIGGMIVCYCILTRIIDPGTAKLISGNYIFQKQFESTFSLTFSALSFSSNNFS
jgi:hypothetical protein